MFCSQCGTENSEGTKFCSGCGAPIGAASASSGAGQAPDNRGVPVPPPGYAPYTYQQPEKGKGFAVASFVLALIGLILTLIPYISTIGIILCVLGLIFAIVTKAIGNKSGMGTAGLVLSIIGLVWGIVAVLAFAAICSSAVGSLGSLF